MQFPQYMVGHSKYFVDTQSFANKKTIDIIKKSVEQNEFGCNLCYTFCGEKDMNMKTILAIILDMKSFWLQHIYIYKNIIYKLFSNVIT